jgi:ribosomal protein L9
VETLASEQIPVEKKQVFFEKQIKEIGSHSIGVNLGHGIKTSFNIVIKAG